DGGAVVADSQAFLRCLVDNHFPLLGYREYDLATEGDTRVLRERPEKRLGVFRLQDGDSESQLDELAPGVTTFHLSPQLIRLSKSSQRARVNRKAYEIGRAHV